MARAKRHAAKGVPAGVRNVTETPAEPGLPRQNPAGRRIPWSRKNAGPMTITLTGPLMDGRLDGMIDDMLAEAVSVTATQGYADVMLGLNQHIQFPTPYYETQINIARDGLALVVNDRDIIYGPWLEGTSSRNKTTRFKGYASFRRAADNLRRKLPSLIAPVAERWRGRMNGA
jgi:hypothetical protein